jgi:Zn-dependent protease with chaperone function
VYIAALVAIAVALAWPVPRLMAGFTAFRRAPRSALVVWQATAVAAVLAALFVAPAALPLILEDEGSAFDHLGLVSVAGAISGLMLARLLIVGHKVGTNLRTVRRRHRDLVDVLAVHGDPNVRVLEHPTPTAYCLPGSKRRVVLTQGTIDTLPGQELDAVLAHERAHLTGRHDLDRAAVREVGALPTARAIVMMAGGPKPAGSMALREAPSAAKVRIGLLHGRSIAGLDVTAASTLMYAFATSLVAAPVTLLALSFNAL